MMTIPARTPLDENNPFPQKYNTAFGVSPFDLATAEAFRSNILSRGAAADPKNLYKAFRGKEPSVGPLQNRRGLL